jgi:hypothetical protein
MISDSSRFSKRGDDRHQHLLGQGAATAIFHFLLPLGLVKGCINPSSRKVKRKQYSRRKQLKFEQQIVFDDLASEAGRRPPPLRTPYMTSPNGYSSPHIHYRIRLSAPLRSSVARPLIRQHHHHCLVVVVLSGVLLLEPPL